MSEQVNMQKRAGKGLRRTRVLALHVKTCDGSAGKALSM